MGVERYKSKGFKIPEDYSYLDDSYDFDDADEEDEPENADQPVEKAPGGFFSGMAMAFGIGAGIS